MQLLWVVQLAFSIWLLSATIFERAECAQKSEKNGVVKSSPKIVRQNQDRARKAIIKCCGKTKCTDAFLKKKTKPSNVTSILTLITQKPTNAVSSTKGAIKTTRNIELLPSTTNEPGDVGASELVPASSSSDDQSTGSVDTGILTSTNDFSTSIPSNNSSTPLARLNSDASSTSALLTITSANNTKTETKYTATSSEITSTSGGIRTTSSSSAMSNITSDTNTTSGTLTTTPTTSTTTSTTSTTTTTTTTKPILCKTPSCEIYTEAVKVNLSTIAIPTDGSYFMSGGKMNFRIPKLSTLTDAIRNCLRMNMKIIAPDSVLKAQYFKTLIGVMGNTEVNFWTAGTNEGNFCFEEKRYSWCSLGTVMQEENLTPSAADYWWNSSSNAAAADRCLTLKIKDAKSGLNHLECAGKAQILCEPSLFENNVIKKGEQYGVWSKTCGSTYLFGNKLSTWQENFDYCCSLGMKPLAFETLEEFKCIKELVSSNWSNNFNYWTGGSQQGSCVGNWAWCSGTTSHPLPENVTWAFKQPDNKGGNENCLHLRVLKNATGLAISDRNCTNKFIIACEGTPALKSCLTANCPYVNYTKDVARFDSTGSLKGYNDYGSWLTCCGRTFMLSKNKTTWENARKECSLIGMTLVAIEFKAKHDCVATNFGKYGPFLGKDFWTSGTDQGCDGAYRWCSLDRDFASPEINWGAGEPKSATGDCVTVRYSNGSSIESILATAPCSEEKNFICEVRNKDRISLSTQEECIEVWNVSAADMMLFESSYNASVLPRNLKCFIKCMGENMEMFAMGGLFPSSTLLKMIEEIAAEDDAKLQNGFEAYDKCGKIKKVDECETAAEIYQCGRDSAPAITAAIYTKASGNGTIYGPPVPCIAPHTRQCRFKGLPCVVDEALKTQLLTTNATSSGKIKYYGGKKYFHSLGAFNSQHLIKNYNYCCSIGMKLAEFSSAEQFQLIVANAPDGHIMFEDTYAVGDGTDRWCGSDTLVPQGMYVGGVYPDPKCGPYNCFTLRFGKFNALSDGNCLPNTHGIQLYFCSE